jgi:hypothetical protein
LDVHLSLEGGIPIGRNPGVATVDPEGKIELSVAETVGVGTSVEAVGVVKAVADDLNAETAAETVDLPPGKRLNKRSRKPWRTPKESRLERSVKSVSFCWAPSSE